MGNMKDRRNSSVSHSVERSGEIARMKAGSRATMEELQEFLGEVRGKSPQQVLGLVAASGLTQGIILSTLVTVIVLFTITAGQYLYYGDSATADAEKNKKAAAKAEAEKADAEADTSADSSQDKKAAAVKAMTEELEETKGGKGEMPDIDDLLK